MRGDAFGLLIGITVGWVLAFVAVLVCARGVGRVAFAVVAGVMVAIQAGMLAASVVDRLV